MKITKDLEQLSQRDARVLTIGNFDGVHLGHQALLKDVVMRAQALGGESVVLTFQPHPLAILAPHLDVQCLTTQDEKNALFEQAGIQHVICLQFSLELAELSAEAFVSEVLLGRIGLCELFIGNSFRFGKNRTGTIESLLNFGPKMQFLVTPILPIEIEGKVVSSSAIREYVKEGRLSEASRFLGRPYVLDGIVRKGEGNGAALGYPTANLSLPTGRVIPPNGVYATIVTLDNVAYPSISYIGHRPVFEGQERLLEVHIFDFTDNLYGKFLQVSFVEFIRKDMMFSSKIDLARQIEDDVNHVHLALKT